MAITFSMRIKELRKKLNQTQWQFAEFVGTTQGALSGYENGDRTPSYDVLISIAQKCNVSIDMELCRNLLRSAARYAILGIEKGKP